MEIKASHIISSNMTKYFNATNNTYPKPPLSPILVDILESSGISRTGHIDSDHRHGTVPTSSLSQQKMIHIRLVIDAQGVTDGSVDFRANSDYDRGHFIGPRWSSSTETYTAVQWT